MKDKIEIPISESHKKLLHETVKDDIIDSDIDRAVSNVVSQKGKYYIYLDVYELEDLIGTVCFIANHEEKDKNLILELDELIDYLECILDEYK